MAVLQCEKCGFSKSVPERYLDTKVRCPKCDAVTVIQADAGDLGLEDVIDENGEDSGETRRTQGGIPAEALLRRADPPMEETPGLFEGGLVKNVLAGVVSGLLTFVVCISVAGLIFGHGDLAPYFPHAASMALVSAMAMGLVAALGSGIPFCACGPGTLAGVFLLLIASSIEQAMPDVQAAQAYPTIIAAVFVAAASSGLAFLAVGATRNADYARYIPIQAVGGVLAGVGALLLLAGMRFALGATDCPDILQMLYSGTRYCINWAPAVAFGLVLFAFMGRLRNSYYILLLVLVCAGAFHGWLRYSGTSLEQARAAGLLFAPFAPDMYWKTFVQADFLGGIDWMVILGHAGHFVALAGLMMASAMIRVTEMEVVDSRPLNLDREFKVLGLGNLLGALAGGMPGSMSHDRSLARRAAGARGRSSGLAATLVLAPGLLLAHQILPWLPRFIPAGVVVAMGLGLLWRWLVMSKNRFTHRGDYGLLWLVFLLTASLGLLTGLAVGAGLAMLVTAGRYGSVSVVKHDMSGSHFHSNVDRGPAEIAALKAKGDAIYALTLQGFIFLGTTNGLMTMIHKRARDTERPRLRFVLLDFTFISGLDSSVAVSFIKLKQMAARQGFTLIFTNVPFEMEDQLKRAGCVLDDPEGGSVTVISLDYALEWAENHLLEQEGILGKAAQPLDRLLEPVFPEKRFIPALMRIVRRVEVKKGKPVFKQGDPSDSMYFIEKGTVNVQLELEGGKLLRLKKMGPGTVFGEMGLYTSAPRTASIVAAEDCVLYRLSAKVMDQLQRKHPEVASAIHRFIVSLLADRVAGANAAIRDLLR